jgi:hypothetical protein
VIRWPFSRVGELLGALPVRSRRESMVCVQLRVAEREGSPGRKGRWLVIAGSALQPAQVQSNPAVGGLAERIVNGLPFVSGQSTSVNNVLAALAGGGHRVQRDKVVVHSVIEV